MGCTRTERMYSIAEGGGSPNSPFGVYPCPCYGVADTITVQIQVITTCNQCLIKSTLLLTVIQKGGSSFLLLPHSNSNLSPVNLFCRRTHLFFTTCLLQTPWTQCSLQYSDGNSRQAASMSTLYLRNRVCGRHSDHRERMVFR